DGVKGMARGAKDGEGLCWAFHKAFQVVLAVVEDHTAIGLIDAVIEIVAEFAATDGLADDLCNGSGRGGDQKPPRLGENLNRSGKKAVQFGIDRFGQALESRDGAVVMGGEATTDGEQLKVEAARSGLGEDAGGPV